MEVKAKHDVSVFGLEADKEYTVIGLSHEYFRVLDDLGDPILFPRTAFVILDDQVPADWVWDKCSSEEFYADPPGLCDRGFYEAYFDGREYAIKRFAAYRESVGLLRNASLAEQGDFPIEPAMACALGFSGDRARAAMEALRCFHQLPGSFRSTRALGNGDVLNTRIGGCIDNLFNFRL